MPSPDANEGTIRCRRCLRETPADELDRLLWCEACVAAERRRARWWGRALGVLGTALLALWIALVIRPGPDFRVLWLLVLLVALGLGARLAEELFYGVVRVRNRPRAREDAVDDAGSEGQDPSRGGTAGPD